MRIVLLRNASAALLPVAAIGCLLTLASGKAHAQWWRSGPADYEECADLAAKAPSKEEKTSKLSECNAKFAGRRKAGGGYTYFDFMQNRTFEIAGPNPTPEEQKKIDEEYIGYLERERRSTAAAALAAKHQQQEQQRQLQQASLKSEPERPRSEPGKVPVPVASPAKQPPPGPRLRANASCVKGTFSCDWPRISEGISDLKKLFGASPNNKGKKS